MANRILGCLPTISYHGGVPFFFFFFSFWRLQWSDQLSCKISDEQMKHASQGELNLIWKITHPTTTSSWAKNSVTKWEVFWRFWKVAHEKIYLEWFEMPCIGIYSGLFEINLVLGSWMHE
jgi:hypothetical protein